MIRRQNSENEINRFKLLKHLYGLRKDGEFHDIERLFGDNFLYKDSENYKYLIKSLTNDKLIDIKTGTGVSFMPSWQQSECYRIKNYLPIEARINEKGINMYQILRGSTFETFLKIVPFLIWVTGVISLVLMVYFNLCK